MIKTAIQYVVGLSGATKHEVGERVYYDKQLVPVKPPVQDEINVNTLTAIADYFRQNPDQVKLEHAIVHVSKYDTVTVFSPVMSQWMQRGNYLCAKTNPIQFQYDRPLQLEEFIVALQTCFVQTQTIKDLLSVVGTMTDTTEIKVIDDGVSQQVTAKTGIASVGNVQLVNPIELVPYRTFLEVAQPAGKFILRLKRGSNGGGITATLSDADGGNWRNEAQARIKAWLQKNLPENTMILA